MSYEVLVKQAEEYAAQLNKQFGKSTVLRGAIDVEFVIPTGSITLDHAIGVGGYPGGRITEIFGADSTGKSTLCLTACAMAQKMDVVPTYIDVEQALDTSYAKQLGVDINAMIIIQPNSAEDALSMIEKSVEMGSKLIILDSVGAMSPHREGYNEGEIGDPNVGLLPKLMAQGTRRLTPLLNKYQSVCIFVNQKRAKIGGMAKLGGPPGEETPGGFALKHAYSVRIKTSRTGTNSEDDMATSIKVKAEVKKNKVAPPFREGLFNIGFGTGVDVYNEISNIALDLGLITRSGSWYKHNGDTVGQGMDSVSDYWIKNKDIAKSILVKYDSKIKSEFYI